MSNSKNKDFSVDKNVAKRPTVLDQAMQMREKEPLVLKRDEDIDMDEELFIKAKGKRGRKVEKPPWTKATFAISNEYLEDLPEFIRFMKLKGNIDYTQKQAVEDGFDLLFQSTGYTRLKDKKAQ